MIRPLMTLSSLPESRWDPDPTRRCFEWATFPFISHFISLLNSSFLSIICRTAIQCVPTFPRSRHKTLLLTHVRSFIPLSFPPPRFRARLNDVHLVRVPCSQGNADQLVDAPPFPFLAWLSDTTTRGGAHENELWYDV